MRRLDGSDIKYLLEKDGVNLSDIARGLDVTPQAVWNVIWGCSSSRKIITHIERLLKMKAGTLRIVKRKPSNILSAA